MYTNESGRQHGFGAQDTLTAEHTGKRTLRNESESAFLCGAKKAACAGAGWMLFQCIIDKSLCRTTGSDLAETVESASIRHPSSAFSLFFAAHACK